MKNHIDMYIRYWGLEDHNPCLVCGSRAVDIHHIKYKSRGGKDNIENLCALCRDCHTKAHQEIIKEEELQKLNDEHMLNF